MVLFHSLPAGFSHGAEIQTFASKGWLNLPDMNQALHTPALLKLPVDLKITEEATYSLDCISSIRAKPVSFPIASRRLSEMSGLRIESREPLYALSLFRPYERKKPSVKALYRMHGYNRAVRRSLYFFSRKERQTLRKRLSRASKYIDVVADIIARKGLPVELAYLPLIESGFDPYAYSPKRAAGLWQFIPATAKKYGLKIDWWVDERRDPVKSTLAAARYLKDLYKKFGNWNLALAAYNAGEGKISRAIRRVRKRDYWTIRKTRYITKETRNYVPSYIALATIAIAPERFGFKDIDYHGPFEYDVVEIDTPMDLSVVAKFTGVKVSKIKELNPELRRWCTPPNVSHYTLRIPPGTKERFLANLANAREDELLYVKFYKVKKGDTVAKIARQLGTSIQAIIDINSLGKNALIIAGKSILVPVDRERLTAEAGSLTLKPILKAREL